jgi:formylglycine-generating enzyme required for sulfatase activity
MKRFFLILVALILGLTACGPAEDLSSWKPDIIIDTGVDPDAWATVAAGEFPSGQHDQIIDLDYDYQIMVTDVTVQQYAAFLHQALEAGVIQIGNVDVIENENVTSTYGVIGAYDGDPFDGYKHEDPIAAGEKLLLPLEGMGERISYEGGSFSIIPEFANHPVTMVSWFGAEAYCSFYGWRLPLELEWEKAARGPELDSEGRGRPFPWGSEIHGSFANYYSSSDLYEKIIGKSGGTTPVGLYNGNTYQDFETEDQASPYGLYDMAGNVWQWTGDDYPKQHYRYLRGGSFYSYEVDLRVWKNNSAGPTYYAADVGFRCARDQ